LSIASEEQLNQIQGIDEFFGIEYDASLPPPMDPADVAIEIWDQANPQAHPYSFV